MHTRAHSDTSASTRFTWPLHNLLAVTIPRVMLRSQSPLLPKEASSPGTDETLLKLTRCFLHTRTSIRPFLTFWNMASKVNGWNWDYGTKKEENKREQNTHTKKTKATKQSKPSINRN